MTILHWRTKGKLDDSPLYDLETCPKGHEFVARGEARNQRTCKQCFNEYQREYLRTYRARKRQEAQEKEAS